MENRAFLPVKSDVIFRLFYADERNQEFLVSLLKSMLRLPEDDYDEIEIADPHLLREFVDDKLAVVDVKLHTKSKKVVHIYTPSPAINTPHLRSFCRPASLSSPCVAGLRGGSSASHSGKNPRKSDVFIAGEGV
jgi:hypothetical protein